MSKLIAQAFLSLMVSLGLVAGTNPNVRGEVKQVWQETKAIAHQTVDFATGAATDLASQVVTHADVEADAETATDVYFGEDSWTGVETDIQAEGSAEAETEDGILLNFGGSADTGLKIDLGFWR